VNYADDFVVKLFFAESMGCPRSRLNAYGKMRGRGLRPASLSSLVSTVDAGADRRFGWMVFRLANVHIMLEIVS
jgi:hypothetical protein